MIAAHNVNPLILTCRAIMRIKEITKPDINIRITIKVYKKLHFI